MAGSTYFLDPTWSTFFHPQPTFPDFAFPDQVADWWLEDDAQHDYTGHAYVSMAEVEIYGADGGITPQNAEHVSTSTSNLPQQFSDMPADSSTTEAPFITHINLAPPASNEGLVPSVQAESLELPTNGYAASPVELRTSLENLQAPFAGEDQFDQRFDPSLGADNDSPEPSEVNTIQAFARLEFDDGDYYMTTYAVELGRDARAAQREALSRGTPQPLDPSVRRSRKRSVTSDTTGRSKKRRKGSNRYSGSVVSESGGIIGIDPPERERERASSAALDKAASSRSSSLRRLSRRSSVYAPMKDYNQLTLELAEWTVQQPNANPETLKRRLEEDQLPPLYRVPLIPIHPPINPDGSSDGHQGISRKHVRVFYNFKSRYFQVCFYGRNGGFVDDQWYAQGEHVTLVSSSVIQLKDICIRFTLPNVPEGETGAEAAEEAGLAYDWTSQMASSDEADNDEQDQLENSNDLQNGTGLTESEDTGDQSEGQSPPSKRQAKAKKSLKPEVEAPKPKRKGPGRPPKNGYMSKREQQQLAREARENATAKAEGKTNQTQGRGKGKTAKALELEASRLQPNGKRKYTKRKKAAEPEEVQKVRESTEQDDSGSPETATKPVKDKKPIKPPRSPSPVFNEAELTPEQLAKPASSYVVLIHEALSNSKTGQMSLPQIYRAIERRYPFFKLRVTTQGWQSSVRHNLSQHAAFTKITRDGKGWMWGLVPEVSIEKEKKRRPTPPPAPQQNYQYPPQAPRYPQVGHQYPYQTTATGHSTMPFPYTLPPMPYPPRIGTGGIPMPFVQPQAESTYKSPYDSNPDPAPKPAPPAAAPASTENSSGNNGRYPIATSQPQQQQAPAPQPNGIQPKLNAPTGVQRYSDEFLGAINDFKTQLIKSLKPSPDPEKLVSSVINHKLYGAPLDAEEGSDAKTILNALETIVLPGARGQSSADSTAAHSVETVTEKAADIARKIQDDKSTGTA